MNLHSTSRVQMPKRLGSPLVLQSDPTARFRDRLHSAMDCAPDFIRPDQWIRFGIDDDVFSSHCFARLDADLQCGVFGCYEDGDLHVWKASDPVTHYSCGATWKQYPVQCGETLERRPQSISEASKLWQRGDVLREGDPAFQYITQLLGIPPQSVPACARFHAAVPYRVPGAVGYRAALLMPLQSPAGLLMGVQATYLNDDGQLADGLRLKRRIFRVKGTGPFGFVPTHLPQQRMIGVARTVDDAMLATAALAVPTLATVTIRGLAEFEWPEVVERLVIFASGLSPELTATRALVRRATACGVQCTVVRPNAAGEPVDAVLRRYIAASGKEAVCT